MTYFSTKVTSHEIFSETLGSLVIQTPTALAIATTMNMKTSAVLIHHPLQEVVVGVAGVEADGRDVLASTASAGAGA